MGYWPFSGNARDATPHSNNGTVTGATLTTDRKGRANSAYAFDGSSSVITVPNSPVLNFGTANFSCSLYFKVNALAVSSQQLVSNRGGTGSSYELQVHPSGVLNMIFGPNLLYSNLVVVPGTWYLATVVRDGTAIKLYVNGNTEISSTDNTDVTNTADLRFGRDGFSDYLNGDIDEVRFYNRSLSVAEIQALYNSIN